MAAKKKTYEVKLWRDGMKCAIPVPFDPTIVFGKARAPVNVTLNRYSFRSTIATYGGEFFIPFRKSNREAAGLEGTETLKVTLELDEEERTVKPPSDFVKALKASPPAWDRWQEASYTHQREYADALADAKKPETRVRRIASAVAMLAAKPPKRAKITAAK